MPIPLKYSTASQEVLLGPFLDDTDGKTIEDGLTIANTDIKLWKAGATSEANKNSGGATHIAGGRYYAVLDATDTNTYGPMEINVHMSGALPVRREFWVMNADAYDALMSASSGSIRSDGRVILGEAIPGSPTADSPYERIKALDDLLQASGAGDAAAIKAKTDLIPASPAQEGTLTTIDGIVDAIKAKTDNLPASPAQEGTLTTIDGIVDAIKLKTDLIPASPAAVGSAMTLSDDAITSAKFDESTAFPLKSADTGATAVARVGADSDTLETLSDQIDLAATAAELAKVPKSDGSASWNATALAAINAEVDTALNTAVPGTPTADSINERVKALDDLKPASTIAAATDIPGAATIADSVWDELLGGHIGSGSAGLALTSSGSPPSAATIADAVWDEASTGHTDAGKAGAQQWTDIDAVKAVTDKLDTTLVQDGAVYDFTTAALAAAPGGSSSVSFYGIIVGAMGSGTPKISIAAIKNGQIITSSSLSVTVKQRVPGGTAVTRATITSAAPAADHWYDENLGFTPSAGVIYTVTGTITIDSASRNVAALFVQH